MERLSFGHRSAQTALTDTWSIKAFDQSSASSVPLHFPVSLLKQPEAANGGLVPLMLYGTPQALSGAGAVNVTAYKTNWTTTGANAGTLADGTYTGQLKLIQMIVDAGDGTLTPANFADGSTITFADAGDCALLIFDGTDWNVVDLYNCADGATAPVVA